MAPLRSIFGLLAVTARLVNAATDEGTADEMGPAAFMWPKDRVWSAAMDNTAPCGSSAKPGDRSEYPLRGAKIALVGQDESFDIQLGIAYMDNPTKNSDFNILIDADEFADIDPGHTCVNVKDVRGSARAGDKATLQIKYIADFDKPENQTFYACADVTFVELADFNEAIPCFNATREEGDTDETTGDDWYHGDAENEKEGTKASGTGSSSGSKSTGTSSSSSDEPKASGGSSGLSGGAIAGIVVGSVAGLAIVAGLAFLWYRQSSKKLSIMRQQTTSRGVNWEMQPPKTSQSGTSSVRNETA